jgi:hypothetical protein
MQEIDSQAGFFIQFVVSSIGMVGMNAFKAR